MIRRVVCLFAVLGWTAFAAVGARAGEELDMVAVAAETDRLGEKGFTEMLAREQRMIAISIRLRRAGMGLCGEHVAPILGLQVMTTRGLPYAHFNPAIRQLGVSNDLRVAWVAPGAAAEKAGLLPGDVLRSIDGRDLEGEVDLNSRRAARSAPSLRFGIERSGEKRFVDVPYEPGCSVQPMLMISTAYNAFTGSEGVIVMSEVLRDARNDDEVAAVVAHEYGHDVLEHRRSNHGAEEDADYFGLYLLARAGYSPEAGSQLWRRVSRTAPWKLIESRSHPSAPERAVSAARAIDEISAKQATGQPLTPEGIE